MNSGSNACTIYSLSHQASFPDQTILVLSPAAAVVAGGSSGGGVCLCVSQESELGVFLSCFPLYFLSINLDLFSATKYQGSSSLCFPSAWITSARNHGYGRSELTLA